MFAVVSLASYWYLNDVQHLRAGSTCYYVVHVQYSESFSQTAESSAPWRCLNGVMLSEDSLCSH